MYLAGDPRKPQSASRDVRWKKEVSNKVRAVVTIEVAGAQSHWGILETVKNMPQSYSHQQVKGLGYFLAKFLLPLLEDSVQNSGVLGFACTWAKHAPQALGHRCSQ